MVNKKIKSRLIKKEPGLDIVRGQLDTAAGLAPRADKAVVIQRKKARR